MSKIITVNDLNSTKFYQLPKAFFHNSMYINMKNESKIAYSILRDLLELSLKNNWINKSNEVYVKLSREKLMQYLNIKGKQKITQIMDELKSKELIVENQLGLKKCNEIYICIPDELSEIYDDKELLEKTAVQNVKNTLKFENQTSRSSKNKSQEVRKTNLKKFVFQTYTNTNITNTNSINTNTNTSSSSICECFEKNICELKQTTKTKMLKIISLYDKDFLIAIIEECTTSNVRSFNGFNSALKSYLQRNCATSKDVQVAAEKFRMDKKKRREKAKISNNNHKKESTFNNYDQRKYDGSDGSMPMNDLEKKLLRWE